MQLGVGIEFNDSEGEELAGVGRGQVGDVFPRRSAGLTAGKRAGEFLVA